MKKRLQARVGAGNSQLSVKWKKVRTVKLVEKLKNVFKMGILS